MPARGTILDAAGIGKRASASTDTKWHWKPNPPRDGQVYSQQEKVLLTTDEGNPFCQVQCKEVLFGGAPGGGKTNLMLAMAYLHILEFGKDAVVGMFRQETPEFRDILRQAKEMYLPLGGHWNLNARLWTFPNGGVIQMTYLRNMDDAYGHKGAAYSLLLWDEITGWPDEGPYEFLLTRLRSTNPAIFCQSVATANPDGPGMGWVRERFRIMDPACPPERPFRSMLDPDLVALDGEEPPEPHWVIFVPSLLSDNPHLTKDDQYRAGLYAQRDPVRRNAYIKGDWSVFQGQAYPKYSEKKHVIPDFPPPHNWPKWAGMDWGGSTPYCVLYLTMDPNTQHIYVVRETYGADPIRRNRGLQRSSAEVAKEEWDLRGSLYNPQVLAVDGSTYNNRSSETTIADDWVAAGWVCERGNRDRRTRGEKIRDALDTILPDGRPLLQICESCVNLRRTLPVLVMDENKPEEVKDGGEDHPWDTLGFALCCSVATSMMGFYLRAMGIGPMVADPRNQHYDSNAHWNGAPQQRIVTDHLKEEFDAYILSRSKARG